MILKVFSIYDGKTSSYMRPFFDAHTGSAIRSFQEACNEPTSPFSKFPQDFILYEVGAFDDEQAKFATHTAPVQLATSLEYALKKPSKEAPNVYPTQGN